ncbi:hypothetical protein CRN36_07080 [Vibrio vulnificus]|uniref:entry exclusion protein EexS n=1 Tax=Vibrio vulnificus TaxID=672 RepID=UPI000CD09311|nr:entry exclusion protein EexS [Vibrio vulnificus]POB18742.1 hypothetical protein CRN36_07080 [Vibrio vulnificus]
MTNLLKSLPARSWFISLGLFLATLASAHFFPSEILTASAKLAAWPFLICTIVFFSYLGFKATASPIGLTTLTTVFVAIAYWQASWTIVGLGIFFLAICTGIRFLSSQVKDSGRTLSIEEKWYWYKLHLFFDGFYPRYPKKPKK